jgi:hypothetical protein
MQQSGRSLLVIVNLRSKAPSFPTDVLAQVDAALASVGFRKQIRSVLVPGKEFAITYDGPAVDKRQVEDLLGPLATRNGVIFSVEVEESVSFP